MEMSTPDNDSTRDFDLNVDDDEDLLNEDFEAIEENDMMFLAHAPRAEEEIFLI